MNNEQQELLDEAYKNYCTQLVKDSFLLSRNRLPLDVFINKCKTDSEFSEKWGLKIEERELNDDELNIFNLLKQTFTKLITITHKDKTIESYK